MRTRWMAFALAMVLTAGPAFAAGDDGQTSRRPMSRSEGGRGKIVGLVLGAGAGFGLGLLLGVKRLPDASCTDRRVLTAGAAFGTIGGITGYMVGREMSEPSLSRTLPIDVPVDFSSLVLPVLGKARGAGVLTAH